LLKQFKKEKQTKNKILGIEMDITKANFINIKDKTPPQKGGKHQNRKEQKQNNKYIKRKEKTYNNNKNNIK
jgi:hypothetical protein